MANQYRISRNIEASILDFLDDLFNGFGSDWYGISVEKTFAKIYKAKLPSVCVRVGVTTYDRVEIGNTAIKRTAQIFIDLFTQSDGQRLDLKDYIIEKTKGGFPYYDYEIKEGVVKSKTESGRVSIRDIDDTPVDFDIDKDKLSPQDKYRHLITLTCSLGQVEN